MTNNWNLLQSDFNKLIFGFKYLEPLSGHVSPVIIAYIIILDVNHFRRVNLIRQINIECVLRTVRMKITNYVIFVRACVRTRLY